MPYGSVAASKAVAVSTVAVSVTVSPVSPWYPGKVVTIVATVTKDGAPWAGRAVSFHFGRTGVVAFNIGSGTTGSDGKASFNYTIPWDKEGFSFPCQKIFFTAVDDGTLVTAAKVEGWCAYTTKLTISAPDSVARDVEFTVSGKLTFEVSSGYWSISPDKTIEIYCNGTKLAEGKTTAPDGNYYITCKIPATFAIGIYTLKAVFAGAGFTAAGARRAIKFAPKTEASIANWLLSH